ncbi:MAG: hypothetical protein K2W97_05220 [Chthoniobacterales bacterium]|nr:hypothetical protein [Chthoniobacterales bacterium]
MATFYYSPTQNPPAPPAYIKAAAATAADSKWYDSNVEIKHYYLNQLPKDSDNLPYDHAFPYGVDPNDSSKPYAPYGFYCDENGNPTTLNVYYAKNILISELAAHPDSSDPKSPLNVYNIESPMDPYNMQQFFYAEKPGSPFHQYERQPDQVITPTGNESALDYLEYSDYPFAAFKNTPENFPWLHDQDPAHHYRNGNVMPFYSTVVVFFGPDKPQINITEKIWLDSPVAPAGWQEVQQPTTPAQ